jgi:multiple sugar transport system substrate-binding protein
LLFGVDYPKNGMNWDEVTALIRKVTRMENSTQNYGFATNPVWVFGSQTSQPIVDAKTNEATLNNDAWKQTFQKLQSIYDIPGNTPPQGSVIRNMFFKDQNLAMILDWVNGVLPLIQEMQKSGAAFNWDMVTIPYADKPGVGWNVDTHVLNISKVSKHQQEAFQVLSVLTSDPLQTKINREGKLTSLANEGIKKQFGADMEILKNKNTSAIFNTKSAATNNPTLYDLFVRKSLVDAFNSVIYAGKDINSALREAQEVSNKQIKEMLSK